ncbi:hypothetical protein MHI01_30920 [Paenibacillus sp. FSL M7-0656]|uniref:hypothetical protein n=1 Tax=Paenibacillus sp. FSL M7-0656 TaxID=2921534 RepID=UPI0030F7BABC
MAMIRVEVTMMRTKTNDPGTRLAQEIIQFAKSNNLKIRKKSRSTASSTKNVINKQQVKEDRQSNKD